MIRIEKSRKLAKLLRWDKPECYETGGWRRVEDILQRLDVTIEELQELVQSDPKNQNSPGRGRFEFSADLSKIRARDGHANWIPLEEKRPTESFPAKLYHGTSLDNVASILSKGILSMDRRYVHLSADRTEAFRVASRRKNPVVLEIDTQLLIQNGGKIYSPDSIAWLCSEVSSKAIKDYMYIGQGVVYFECPEQ